MSRRYRDKSLRIRDPRLSVRFRGTVRLTDSFFSQNLLFAKILNREESKEGKRVAT
uniref:Uncharacterized protein n=1 Tax=Parascaris equorum TaxID=6256 RepID=A0A914R9Y9_PAREQ